MRNFKLGCQTITWGDEQAENFPRVFNEIANAGFQGVEIGWRRMENTPPKQLRKMLDDAGLELLGSHIGGNLMDKGQAKGEWDVLDRVIGYLGEMNAGLLMFSGLKYQNREQFERDYAVFTQIRERCEENAIKLLYHNHNWEFQDENGFVMRWLENDDQVNFCPDVGWIHKGTEEVIPTLEKIKTRIGAVHFKDFASTSDALDPVLFGKGIVPLEKIAGWLRINLDKTIWIIAEQDLTTVSTIETANNNATSLKECFSSL